MTPCGARGSLCMHSIYTAKRGCEDGCVSQIFVEAAQICSHSKAQIPSPPCFAALPVSLLSLSRDARRPAVSTVREVRNF